MEEIWTQEAKNTFVDNISFLQKKWTAKEVDAFIAKAFNLIDLLKKSPELGQFDPRWEAYKFLVVPQIYLFYIFDENNLILLSFWNNFQKPLF